MMCRLAPPLIVTSVVVKIASAQTTVFCDWQLSLDNGTTWQAGNVSAPPTQSSVWVRAVTTVRDNGVPVPSGIAPNFLAAAIEGWSLTAAPTNDQVVGISVLTPSVPAAALSAPFAQASLMSRRFGSLLIADRRGDTSPPGEGLGIGIRNLAGGAGQVPATTNPLPIFVMSVALDGSFGDRVFSGAFVGFTDFSFIAPSNSVAVGNPFLASSTWQVAPVTQTPVTLTIIPSPGAATCAIAGAMFAVRRRRR